MLLPPWLLCLHDPAGEVAAAAWEALSAAFPPANVPSVMDLFSPEIAAGLASFIRGAEGDLNDMSNTSAEDAAERCERVRGAALAATAWLVSLLQGGPADTEVPGLATLTWAALQGVDMDSLEGELSAMLQGPALWAASLASATPTSVRRAALALVEQVAGGLHGGAGPLPRAVLPAAADALAACIRTEQLPDVLAAATRTLASLAPCGPQPGMPGAEAAKAAPSLNWSFWKWALPAPAASLGGGTGAAVWAALASSVSKHAGSEAVQAALTLLLARLPPAALCQAVPASTKRSKAAVVQPLGSVLFHGALAGHLGAGDVLARAGDVAPPAATACLQVALTVLAVLSKDAAVGAHPAATAVAAPVLECVQAVVGATVAGSSPNVALAPAVSHFASQLATLIARRKSAGTGCGLLLQAQQGVSAGLAAPPQPLSQRAAWPALQLVACLAGHIPAPALADAATASLRVLATCDAASLGTLGGQAAQLGEALLAIGDGRGGDMPSSWTEALYELLEHVLEVGAEAVPLLVPVLGRALLAAPGGEAEVLDLYEDLADAPDEQLLLLPVLLGSPGLDTSALAPAVQSLLSGALGEAGASAADVLSLVRATLQHPELLSPGAAADLAGALAGAVAATSMVATGAAQAVQPQQQAVLRAVAATGVPSATAILAEHPRQAAAVVVHGALLASCSGTLPGQGAVCVAMASALLQGAPLEGVAVELAAAKAPPAQAALALACVQAAWPSQAPGAKIEAEHASSAAAQAVQGSQLAAEAMGQVDVWAVLSHALVALLPGTSHSPSSAPEVHLLLAWLAAHGEGGVALAAGPLLACTAPQYLPAGAGATPCASPPVRQTLQMLTLAGADPAWVPSALKAICSAAPPPAIARVAMACVLVAGSGGDSNMVQHLLSATSAPAAGTARSAGTGEVLDVPDSLHAPCLPLLLAAAGAGLVPAELALPEPQALLAAALHLPQPAPEHALPLTPLAGQAIAGGLSGPHASTWLSPATTWLQSVWSDVEGRGDQVPAPQVALLQRAFDVAAALLRLASRGETGMNLPPSTASEVRRTVSLLLPLQEAVLAAASAVPASDTADPASTVHSQLALAALGAGARLLRVQCFLGSAGQGASAAGRQDGPLFPLAAVPTETHDMGTVEGQGCRLARQLLSQDTSAQVGIKTKLRVAPLAALAPALTLTALPPGDAEHLAAVLAAAAAFPRALTAADAEALAVPEEPLNTEIPEPEARAAAVAAQRARRELLVSAGAAVLGEPLLRALRLLTAAPGAGEAGCIARTRAAAVWQIVAEVLAAGDVSVREAVASFVRQPTQSAGIVPLDTALSIALQSLGKARRLTAVLERGRRKQWNKATVAAAALTALRATGSTDAAGDVAAATTAPPRHVWPASASPTSSQWAAITAQPHTLQHTCQPLSLLQGAGEGVGAAPAPECCAAAVGAGQAALATPPTLAPQLSATSSTSSATAVDMNAASIFLAIMASDMPAAGASEFMASLQLLCRVGCLLPARLARWHARLPRGEASSAEAVVVSLIAPAVLDSQLRKLSSEARPGQGDALGAADAVTTAFGRSGMRWFHGDPREAALEAGQALVAAAAGSVGMSLTAKERGDAEGKAGAPEHVVELGLGAASGDSTFKVIVQPEAFAVDAHFAADEAKLGIRIQLPPSYPLRRPELRCLARVGVSDAVWRRWELQLRGVLSSRGGSLWAALSLWRETVKSTFTGVEPCPICYSLLHHSDKSLPKMLCGVCSSKFHAGCLYKWFRTSGDSKCPMCRATWAA